MDKKFLHKVVDQIISETRIDYAEERIYPPDFPYSSSLRIPYLPPLSPFSFAKHCKEVYGLNHGETEYVWNEYVKIIEYKINNNE